MPGVREAHPRSGFALILYVFAFLSGGAALVYQVAWTSMLSLTFGRTTLAASTVLSGFMAGMGIGAWLYHRLQGQRFDALRLYAALEIGIALATALLTAALSGLPVLFSTVAKWGLPGPALDLFRVLFVIAILVVPAALMGATYPALCAVLIRSREGVAAHLGPIYGVNTVGAAFGALVAGFVLIEQIGLSGAVRTANWMNFAIGFGAAWLGREARAGEPPLPALEHDEAVLPTRLPRWVSGAVLSGSGFATLAYEIIWFRALRTLLGSSTYAFTTMLVVFLLGLGFGGLLGRRALAGAAPERSLALSQLGIGMLAVAAIGILAAVLRSPELLASVSIFQGEVAALPWWGRLLVHFTTALAMMLPATLLMGLSFPLASGLFLGDVRRLGERVGAATLLANLGSILGAVSASLLLVPGLGTIGATRATALVNVALGAGVLTRVRTPAASRLAWVTGALAAVAAAFLVLPAALPFRAGSSFLTVPMRLLFEEEGDLSTVQVWAAAQDPSRRMITVDGAPIGETAGLRPPIRAKQILLAHLPLVLDPRIRHTLNVGLGSSSTLHSLASYADIETLDTVEISGAVVRGSRLFEESAVLSDPRARLHVEDVAHFLLKQATSYDLIVSDGKLGDDFSGNTLMLCTDFYARSKARLSRDGLFIQWIPLRYPLRVFGTVLRTFLASFPEVELFFEDPGGVFLVGSRAEIRGRARGRLTNPRARQELAGLGIPHAAALLSRWVAGGTRLREVVGPGPVNTWDHPAIEYAVYRSNAVALARSTAANLQLLLRAAELERSNPFVPEGSPWLASTRALRSARVLALQGRYREALGVTRRALAANPQDPVALSRVQIYEAVLP